MYTFHLDNIKCGGCAHRIEDKIAQIEDIQKVNVNVEAGTVSVQAPDSPAMREKILASLLAMGYPQTGEGNALHTAKSYVSCMIGRVTK